MKINEMSRIIPPELSITKKMKEAKKQFIRTIGSHVMPTQIKGKENIVHQNDLIKKGYKIFHIYDHSSFPDTFHIVKDVIFKNELLHNKKCVIPITIGAYNIFKPIIEPIAHSQNIKLCPVVTPASFEDLELKQRKQLEKARKSHLTTRTSFRMLLKEQIQQRKKLVSQQKIYNPKYLEEVLSTLTKENGTALAAWHATREGWLKSPIKDQGKKSAAVTANLIAHLDRMGENKVAFCLLGLGIKNETNYEMSPLKELIGFFKTYTVNIGPTYTIDELKQMAQKVESPRNTRRGIETVIFEEFKKIVPDVYLNPPQKK